MSTHPFTPTYIAMARAAEEIQAIKITRDLGWAGCHRYEAYDFFFSVVKTVCVGDKYSYHGGGFVSCWLPRLDQLLGMLGTPDDFMDDAFIEGRHGAVVLRFDGFNKDWHEFALVLVMKEKFGKRWDGKEWVK